MTAADSPILPGGTLGVLGGGQLGRMFIEEAHKKGYRVHILAPESASPAGQLADRVFCADYTDMEQVKAFAQSVDAVTFEFENIPREAIEMAAQFAPVRPSGQVLHLSQNRLREKGALQNAGLPVTPYLPVYSQADLTAGLSELGTPAVLKTAAWGYDGKGQARVDSMDQAHEIWGQSSADEYILEKAVDFECEISVIAARSIHGEIVCYEPFENAHANHILDVTLCPARITPALRDQALEAARKVMTALDVVGVLCVEFFVSRVDGLLINELAPRPHNSGHLTIDSCVTSQFEQQLRAVCGLPLGSVRPYQPGAMINLLGDLWENGPLGPLNWEAALASPAVKVRMYGKNNVRAGRKMGHLTALANTVEEAEELVRSARSALCDPQLKQPVIT